MKAESLSDKDNQRRHVLITKKHSSGLTAQEEIEFKKLQAAAGKERERLTPPIPKRLTKESRARGIVDTLLEE